MESRFSRLRLRKHFEDLAGRSFDAIVMSDILTRLADPVDVLRRLYDVAAVDATIVATVPNLREEKVKQAAGRRPSTELPSSMGEHGIVPASAIDVQRWLAAAGFVKARLDYVGSTSAAPPTLGSVVNPLIRFVAQRARPLNPRVEHKGEVPRVSIGLPVFNGERFLEQALSALTKQTWQDLEIIVSDNGSTDGTEQICRNLRRHRPTYSLHSTRGESWRRLQLQLHVSSVARRVLLLGSP